MQQDDESTMLLDAKAVLAAAAPPRVKRLNPNVLPKRSRAQVRCQNLLASLCQSQNPDLMPALGEALDEILEQEAGTHRVSLVGVSSLSMPRPAPRGAHTFLMNFCLVDFETPGMIWADLGLIAGLVRAFLKEEIPQAQGADAREVAPVTPHDFGLMTYLGLKILGRLRGEGLHLPLTLEATPPAQVQYRDYFEHGTGQVAQLSLWIEGASYAGKVEVLVPESMLYKLRHLGKRPKAAGELCHVAVGLDVVIGQVQLGRLDVAGLQRGDVLIPQVHGVVTHGGEQGGAVLVGRGQDRGYAVSVGLMEQGGELRVESDTLQVYRQGDTTQRSEEMEQDPMATMHLSDQAEVEVEIRLARLDKTIQECAQISVGHIMALGKQVEEPVEVVVQGRVVAKGELVDIEGELGVRILERL